MKKLKPNLFHLKPENNILTISIAIEYYSVFLLGYTIFMTLPLFFRLA